MINFQLTFERLFQPKRRADTQDPRRARLCRARKDEAKRVLRDSGPLVELLITTEASADEDDPKAEQTSRELDAEQLAQRIISLTGTDLYSNIALLFRAMTNVQIYESVFRRADIPYQTVLGRGFYGRAESPTNPAAAVFGSQDDEWRWRPASVTTGRYSRQCAVGLRCAPWLDEVDSGDPLTPFYHKQALYRLAVIARCIYQRLRTRSTDRHRSSTLSCARHHTPSAFCSVPVDSRVLLDFQQTSMSARLANVHGSSRSPSVSSARVTHRWDFGATSKNSSDGSRESEGQIDEAANAVRL